MYILSILSSIPTTPLDHHCSSSSSHLWCHRRCVLPPSNSDQNHVIAIPHHCEMMPNSPLPNARFPQRWAKNWYMCSGEISEHYLFWFFAVLPFHGHWSAFSCTSRNGIISSKFSSLGNSNSAACNTGRCRYVSRKTRDKDSCATRMSLGRLCCCSFFHPSGHSPQQGVGMAPHQSWQILFSIATSIAHMEWLTP